MTTVSIEAQSPPSAGGQEKLVLPRFIEVRPDGVFVDPGKLPAADEFLSVVDRIFRSGYFLGGLNYPVFQRLLFDFDLTKSVDLLRLAREIREFAPARRALYRAVKIVGGEVEYIFEPVRLETTVDEPLYEIGEDGERRVVGSERKILTEKASLDVDEFVADLWGKGVRFGIDVAKVEAAIREGRCERVVVAREVAPTAGHDAGIKEQTAELHRDNSPRALANGRVDLRQFQNRFPQMKQGAVLLMKTPRELGKAGRSVAGRRLEPDLPLDFDLASLAGEGTRIEVRGGLEYIIVTKDGFLNLDSKTNCMSITEKIINRDGVSLRTTGNLSLSGEQYEEYGEVQEGRMVEGKSLTFHADVFGKVVSAGGDIVLEHNLVGGTALNHAGSITVSGLASNAVVHCEHGVLRLKRAENSLLIGDRVEVEWASNCTILADEVEIEVAQGCAIGGKRIHLGTAGARNGAEALVSMLLPDLSGIDRAQEKEQKRIHEFEEKLAGLHRGIDQATSQPEVRNYFNIAGKIHRKEISLTAEQQGQWQQMQHRLLPLLKRISQGREEIKAVEGEVAAVQERLAALAAERNKAAAAMECRLDDILGEVVVRALTIAMDATPLARLSPRELRQRLTAPDPGSRRLFAGSKGQFAWRPE